MAGCPAVRQPELSQQPVRPGTAMCRWTRRTEPRCGGGGCREWTWALVRGRTWCDGGGRLSCVSAEEGPGPAGLVVLVRCDWAPCSARSTAAVRRDGRSRASRLADAGRRRRGARQGGEGWWPSLEGRPPQGVRLPPLGLDVRRLGTNCRDGRQYVTSAAGDRVEAAGHRSASGRASVTRHRPNRPALICQVCIWALWPVAGSPTGDRRDFAPGADRGAVTGSA